MPVGVAEVVQLRPWLQHDKMLGAILVTLLIKLHFDGIFALSLPLFLHGSGEEAHGLCATSGAGRTLDADAITLKAHPPNFRVVATLKRCHAVI